MSVPPKTDQDVPPPHRRTLPHVPLNEEGMRELEIWIKRLLGGDRGRGFIRYVFQNIGRWLLVESDSQIPAQFMVGEPLAASILLRDRSGTGIVLSIAQSAPTITHPVIGLYEGGWIGYLDGASDLVYTQGGDFFRDTDGGNVTINTHAGDVLFLAGAFELDASDDSVVKLTVAGKTLSINDASDNPLVTYTG